MFRVMMEETINGKSKIIDITVNTITMQNIIGRLSLKYGPPEELVQEDGVFEWVFEKKIDGVPHTCTLGFAKVSNEEKKKVRVNNRAQSRRVIPMGNASSYPPSPPSKPEEPPTENLQAMLDNNVITKPFSSYGGGRGHYGY